ncbi:hypothetical protein ILUMI_24221 [Ignelater luminosus]|uniref:Protein kintoun n=1 Tax=Ignelater luminosus TaxID=2038154 RepID=A0A8K0C7F4_IGNLU|nr:hypothetical protein ILUMI_24221 [Ignelater luminosus]
MASSYDSFKELNLTRDEVERITDALKDKKFRQLLTEYVDEVRDPENQRLFQKEITQLEKERGVDVTFINPVAGYVIKTSVNGNKKGFINICANEHIQKPAANPDVKEGARGLHWSLPHSLAPPREDVDKKGVRCQVFDVVFHPDTLHLAQRNKAFRDMVNNTACDAVESNFDVTLDKKNLKFPKLQYKGFPQPAVVRKPSTEKPPELSPEEKEIMDKFYAQAGAGEYPPKPQQKSPKKSRKPPNNKKSSKSEDDKTSVYTTPKYVIKHRRHIEMEEFTEHKNCKINTAIPKELIIEVNLPLLKSSTDIILDVAEKTLQLTSEKPAKYKLVLTLPYRVNQDNGNAKFDKDLKKLVITLPVKINTSLTLTDVAKDDSGVESDHGSSSSPIDEIDQNSLVTEINSEEFKNAAEENKWEVDAGEEVQQLLDSNLHYSSPEFTSHIFENTIAFTLNVKNVDETSISNMVKKNAIHLKFSSISSGFYPIHYAFYMKLPNHNIDTDNLSVEVWDNNVIVQINYIPCDNKIRSYLFGLDENNLAEKFFEEPSIISEMLEKNVLEEPSSSEIVQNNSNIEDNKEEKSIKRESKIGKGRKKGKPGLKKRETTASEVEVESLDAETTETEEEEEKGKIECVETKQSTAIDIVGAYSESSSDEISHSFSPTKSRGILKSISNSRRFGRSISESGLDDVAWTSSIENCHTSVDSVIPEEGEMSTSLKKTVRFNDVVSRQLFRSNSSILGQRKKNQRKAKAKKRAQERRHSEGEISEVDDKKERDTETGDECENIENNEKGKSQEKSDVDQKDYFASDIFQLDMNF